MLEEKNDNLSVNENEADGNVANEMQEAVQTENQEVEATQLVEESIPDTEVEAPLGNEAEQTTGLQIEEFGTVAAETESQPVEVAPVAETAPEENIATEESSSDHAINAIADANAEESEDETLKARHDIPMLDYEAMPMEQIVDELEQLASVEKVMSVKDHVEEAKKAFLSKYYHFIDEKKEQYIADNPESTEPFSYHFPLKEKFDTVYTAYRNKKNDHFKSLQTNLQDNLQNRMKIVEELKELVNNPSGNIANSLKQLNDIRDRWKNAGPIPKDKYNHVWNNFHFHIENFYDFLHLDREARDLDFKHNLDLKLKIIARVEELIKEHDINNSFLELQDLHRIWKEDIGPVSRDIREEIWNRFSDLTKQMHDKREAFYQSFRASENENLAKKNDIIAQIEVLANHKVDSHSAWLGQIEKVEALREAFFATGKVPNEVNEETWSKFKNAVRDFNVLKNSFYKEIKKDQSDNLSKKQALVDRANALKVSEDFAATTPLMKQIQEEWKLVGHVPKKVSDLLWKEFRAACNEYFERLKDSKKEENADELAAFEKKREFLEQIKDFELVGEYKTDLDAIKAHIETWKSLGKVPFNRRHIEGRFNKVLDALFEKLSSSKKENDKLRFANKLDSLADDGRKLDNERIFIMRKIDEIQSEIFQLENNIQFFQNNKNAKKENSIVTEVRKSIERHKEDLLTWKDKLKQIREFNK
ncbi:DUF349 domain-containing protein [Flavobacterium sp. SUN046]|uniref:DUF349 domain-containing protein n=1 Tax=Flavobacterium sp. SUN046 TaxID=3002440 RepID=UPI002DB6E681|nr:DUF349 domain-containing protein [Flavobacterium sp. SUN046]MEC4050715.1 DUF349 domain-containing protein [Flavobacterium sp. SUN046]